MIELRYPALQADSLPAEPQGKLKETRSGAAIQLRCDRKASPEDLVQKKNQPLLDFPCGSAGKESACNARDLGSIPGLGRCPGEGKGYPLQYSWASFVAQLVKNLPIMQEILV